MDNNNMVVRNNNQPATGKTAIKQVNGQELKAWSMEVKAWLKVIRKHIEQMDAEAKITFDQLNKRIDYVIKELSKGCRGKKKEDLENEYRELIKQIYQIYNKRTEKDSKWVRVLVISAVSTAVGVVVG